MEYLQLWLVVKLNYFTDNPTKPNPKLIGAFKIPKHVFLKFLSRETILLAKSGLTIDTALFAAFTTTPSKAFAVPNTTPIIPLPAVEVSSSKISSSIFSAPFKLLMHILVSASTKQQKHTADKLL